MNAPKVDVRTVIGRIAATNSEFATIADRDGIVRMTRSMLEKQAADLYEVRSALSALIAEVRNALEELDNVTAPADYASDSIGCAELALQRAIACIGGAA